MPNTHLRSANLLRPDAAGSRRRPPLPPMRLGYLAKASLIVLRVLLVVTTAMAGYAAFHGPHV